MNKAELNKIDSSMLTNLHKSPHENANSQSRSDSSIHIVTRLLTYIKRRKVGGNRRHIDSGGKDMLTLADIVINRGYLLLFSPFNRSKSFEPQK